jgi:hypothetical protein
MPEEKPLGALVDPRGFESTALTEGEYDQLKTALAIVRRCDDDASFMVLNHLLIVESFAENPARRAVTQWDAIAGFLEWIDQTGGSDGILVDSRSTADKGKDILRLHGDEAEVLGQTLETLRREGWLEGWLRVLVGTIADGKEPAEQHPTPLQVMQMLTLAAGEFQEELDSAKRFAARRPDLLFPVMRCEGDDPEMLETPPPARGHVKQPKSKRKAA